MSGHLAAVDAGTRVDLDKVRIRGGESAALGVDGAQVDLRDVVVRDSQPDELTGRFGAGEQVQLGGALALRRALVLRSWGFGVLAVDDRSLAGLEDVRVVEVAGWRVDGERGTGIQIAEAARVELLRVHVERSHGMGLNAELRGVVAGSDLTIHDVRPRDANGAYGRGMEIATEAALELERVWVREARNIAVYGLDPGTRVVLRELRVERTLRSGCFEFSCNAGIADGVSAVLGADVDVRRFVVQDNAQFGVRVVNQSRLALRDGRVSRNAVGVQVITAQYDLGEVMRGVLYEDNPEPVSVLTD